VRVHAIEGLPFSGKSRSIAALAGADDAILTIAEYHDLLDGSVLKNAAHAPRTNAEQLGRADEYYALDEIRWAQIASVPRDSTVLLDRCHLSIVAFAKALDDCYQLGAAPQIATEYERRIESAEFAVTNPDVVVFLEVSEDTAAERIPRLATSMSKELTSVEFVSCLVRAYDHLLGPLDIEVVVVDSNGSLEETIVGVHNAVYRE
jgi:thymidylate kinase